ncbi:MAG TPA: ParB/RepB/Spo0J family partition protein [Rhizomicrobium sp.]|jgi:ParB family chromosome partitioning protein|nr:ParB/RepB/Spo0J family partition protein [Rhizomicrobium sp.]
MSARDTRKAEEGRHRGLGRGLSALIGDEAEIAPARNHNGARSQRTLPVAWLQPNPLQPRKTFGKEELEDLARSIREKGVLQPILVRPTPRGPEIFEIVAGERRWRAAQLAKLHDVPVVVRELTDAESLELAIIENVQRADLNAMEEAGAYQQLIDKFEYTQEKLAQELGKSRSYVANTVRLLKLPEAVQAFIRDGKLSAGHARTLIGDPNAEARARAIIEQSMSVRQAERRSTKKQKRKSAPAASNADIRALETSLSNTLGLKTQIAHKGSTGGELRIAYRTLEQLDDVIRRLSSGK